MEKTYKQVQDNEYPAEDNGRGGYYAFYFWTERNNAPAVLSEVEGYPIHFDTKEEVLEWINKQVDSNVNITWCVTKGNEWDMETLKNMYKK